MRSDAALIQALTGRHGFLLNLGVAEGLEGNHNPLGPLIVEPNLIEERAPECHRCDMAIAFTKILISCP